MDYKERQRPGGREHPRRHQELQQLARIPQLYVKGEFIGGCDIVREMFQAGELQELLKEKGVANASLIA